MTTGKRVFAVLFSVALFLLLGGSPVRGQGGWSFGVDAGVATPCLRSVNAPRLRISMTTAFTARWELRGDWSLRLTLEGIRGLYKQSPSFRQIPLDPLFHTKYYNFFPLTIGIGHSWSLSTQGRMELYAAAGGAWHYLNCQQMESHTVVYDMMESGWSMAARCGVEMTWKHLAAGIHLSAMGNPFQRSEGDLSVYEPNTSLPGGTYGHPVFDQRHATLSGYHQWFAAVTVGYRFF